MAVEIVMKRLLVQLLARISQDDLQKAINGLSECVLILHQKYVDVVLSIFLKQVITEQ